MLQIVRLPLDDDGNVIGRRDLQPLFELREHAISHRGRRALGRLRRNCWWASDSRGRQYRFVVEQLAAAEMAA
jgi:hypothetical protein